MPNEWTLAMGSYVTPEADTVCMKTNLQYIKRKKASQNSTHETILFTKYRGTHI